MIIVAGELRVAPGDRERYLQAVADVARLARAARGCLDFVQAADPLDDGRINVYERWESDADLEAFRNSGGPEIDAPTLISGDVQKYRIAAVEAP
ncbi:quinol monooxygenase YgiN [Actinoplanes lutulentus]|uniref:Antibiotic biosynthesis monooxygenase n=1 Tax=Actinoplanes lutulentus TaxID=1287878 RepID=A0A327ZKF5_9ACTN|nr:antibiotic biosynthesis monooxygenase family protein [Actinoplanes lutulentus]MBB2941013.1 quinol monooxygenase YgiN [Actinoplanes lutulentus]RAK43322.1 antibiotic biosynthesis monooxygenase [Actinoplanes lutulentus]